jgi:hypothetical protein
VDSAEFGVEGKVVGLHDLEETILEGWDVASHDFGSVVRDICNHSYHTPRVVVFLLLHANIEDLDDITHEGVSVEGEVFLDAVDESIEEVHGRHGGFLVVTPDLNDQLSNIAPHLIAHPFALHLSQTHLCKSSIVEHQVFCVLVKLSLR